MSILPLTILPSHPSGFVVARDSCGGVWSPVACHMFPFFFLPLAVMIGYYVAAGMPLHTRDIHTPGGKERLHCREWTFRGSQKKEILHELTYKKAISYKTLFIYSDYGCAVSCFSSCFLSFCPSSSSSSFCPFLQVIITACSDVARFLT